MLKMPGLRWWAWACSRGCGLDDARLERVWARAGSRCQARDGVWWERMSDSGGRGEWGDLPRGCVLDSRLEMVGSRWCWLNNAWGRRGYVLRHA